MIQLMSNRESRRFCTAARGGIADGPDEPPRNRAQCLLSFLNIIINRNAYL